MSERIVAVRVSIFRYVSYEPQPGIVQCEFVDAHDRRWTFTEKTAMVSGEYMDAGSDYPKPGVIPCRVDGRHRDPSGREVIEIATEYFPDGLNSPERWMSFEVSPGSLVEWDWASGVERPWDGRI